MKFEMLVFRPLYFILPPFLSLFIAEGSKLQNIKYKQLKRQEKKVKKNRKD